PGGEGTAEQVAHPSRHLSACRSRRADADGLAVLQGSATKIRAQTGVAQPIDFDCNGWRSEGPPVAPCGSSRPPAFTSPPSTTGEPSDRHDGRSEEHTSELQSRENLVCRLLLEKKKTQQSVCS